jgi:hypothetical protein
VERIDEPEGWRHLQEMAQGEQDPLALAAIIDKMNRLLDQHDWSAAKRPGSHGKRPDCAVGFEIRLGKGAEQE